MTKKKVASAPVSTGGKVATQFKPGADWKGNAKGRPKGSRNQLGEDFLSDMLTVWKEVGEDCIRRTAADHPEKLVSIMAGILPKELNVNTNPVEELSDDELAAGIAFLKSVAAAAAGEGSDQETKH